MSISCPWFIGDHYPALCVAVDNYCERADPSLAAEPVNALTNAAFLIAAWAAWRVQRRHPEANLTIRREVQALIVITAVVGLGSFLFHTVGTRWAEWGDVLPILAFMLLYLWLILTVFFNFQVWAKAAFVSLYLTSTIYLEAAVPAALLWGGALYIPTLIVMTGIGVAVSLRQPPAGRGLFLALGVFLISFAARTLDAPICPTFPLGTHFAWHLLNAMLLYLLIRVAVLSRRLGGLRS